MIAVIDYGMGNLRSVQKALQVVGADARIVSTPSGINKCSKLVLPGVGAFGEGMKELKKLRLEEAIKCAILDGKPFLGLCLGLQLLFERSEEAPGVKGLSILKGVVKKFKPGKKNHDSKQEALKVPHMGWNTIVRAPGSMAHGEKIFKGIPDSSYMYFVHSYYIKPEDKAIAITSTDYGIKFTSGIRKDNVYGFQFHPEKSQAVGLKILDNFRRLR